MGVTNRKLGGSNGYRFDTDKSSSKSPPSEGESSGPVRTVCHFSTPFLPALYSFTLSFTGYTQTPSVDDSASRVTWRRVVCEHLLLLCDSGGKRIHADNRTIRCCHHCCEVLLFASHRYVLVCTPFPCREVCVDGLTLRMFRPNSHPSGRF